MRIRSVMEDIPQNEAVVLKRNGQPAMQPLTVSDRPAERADATPCQPSTERPLHDDGRQAAEPDAVRDGMPLPMGVFRRGEGVNFAFISRNASRVRLELFNHPEDARAARVIDLDPLHNRTGDVWHVWVAGIRPGGLRSKRSYRLA